MFSFHLPFQHNDCGLFIKQRSYSQVSSGISNELKMRSSCFVYFPLKLAVLTLPRSLLFLHLSYLILFIFSLFRRLSKAKVFKFLMGKRHTVNSRKSTDLKCSAQWVITSVKINEDCPNEKSKGYLFRACNIARESHHRLTLAETRGRQRSGKALQWKKGRLQVCPDWRLLARGSWTWVTRRGASYLIG